MEEIEHAVVKHGLSMNPRKDHEVVVVIIPQGRPIA